MQFGQVLKKRLRGMAVRILANIEHTIGGDLDAIGDDEKFTLDGRELKVIRSEILNAAGDTTRSLEQLAGDPSKTGGVSLSRDEIAVLNKAQVDMVEMGQEEVPTFKLFGDFNLLIKIRNTVGAGIVYDKSYTCIGIDDIVGSLMPFLDSAQIAGIKIAGGEYRGWRDAICEMYLEGLGDE